MINLETIGWFGSIALAFCGLPQAIESIRNGNSNGITWGFLSMWLFGEVCTLLYIIPKSSPPLIVNYSFNILFLIVIIKYKIWSKGAISEKRA